MRLKAEPVVWRLLRALGWTATLLWAGVVTSAFATSWATRPDGMSLAAGLIALGIFLLPCAPFWLWQARRIRRRRRAEPVAAAPAVHAPVSRPALQSSGDGLERLSPAIRDEWRQVEQARDLVLGFADDGWVERAALLHVDDHMARLRQLLEADARTDRLGGTSSATLRRQVEQLRALLVALADEAVEHQASLADDDPVPVTLAEARERLATTTQAYRELRGSDGVQGLQQPG